MTSHTLFQLATQKARKKYRAASHGQKSRYARELRQAVADELKAELRK